MQFDLSWLQTLATAAFGAGLAWIATRAERVAQRREDDRRMLLGKVEMTFTALARFERGAAQFMISSIQRVAGQEHSTDAPRQSVASSPLRSPEDVR